jgi:hypothetical protein
VLGLGGENMHDTQRTLQRRRGHAETLRVTTQHRDDPMRLVDLVGHRQPGERRSALVLRVRMRPLAKLDHQITGVPSRMPEVEALGQPALLGGMNRPPPRRPRGRVRSGDHNPAVRLEAT